MSSCWATARTNCARATAATAPASASRPVSKLLCHFMQASFRQHMQALLPAQQPSYALLHDGEFSRGGCACALPLGELPLGAS